jgi:hypothetical protein
MDFSNSTTGDGLIQECERISTLGLGNITGNASRLKDFTARLNAAVDRFHAIAFRNDALWNFDATTQDDLPIADADLEDGIGDYAFDSGLLSVTQAFAKDSLGISHELMEQDDKAAPNAYIGTESGSPTHYELSGNSIILYPKPNYDMPDGLTVTFRRTAPRFAAADTTQAVGVPSLFHPFLAKHASFPYLVEHSLRHASAVAADIAKDELAIANFVANRGKPKRLGLRVSREDNR